MRVVRRGEELRHRFAPEGEVEQPTVGGMELDVGDVVRPRRLACRLECTELVALAGVPVGDFGHPGPPLPLPHTVVLVVRCRRRWEVGRASSTAMRCAAAPKGAADKRCRPAVGSGHLQRVWVEGGAVSW
jgi:hypothetical protein